MTPPTRRAGRRALAALLLAALALPLAAAPTGAAPHGTFAASSQGLTLALTLLATSPTSPEGLTLGVSASQATSDLLARARGGATCQALAPGVALMDLPCTDANSVSAEAPPDADPAERCQAGLPAPLGSVVALSTACGDALARVLGRDPLAEGKGEVGRLDVKLDLSPLSPQLAGSVDQVVDAVRTALLDPLPLSDAVKDALSAALKGDQKALSARLGPATARSFSEGDEAISRVTATGGLIGLVGIPTCTAGATVTCGAVPDPITDGLIIVDLSDGVAEARWDGTAAEAGATAGTRLVRVRLRDLSRPAEAAYTTIELSPGQSQTLLGGTPLETTIRVTNPSTKVDNRDDRGSATAEAVGLEIHALKGLGATSGNNGGLRLLVSSAQASVNGQSPVAVLPKTGGSAPASAAAALLLLAAAGAAWSVRRRVPAAG